MSTSPDRPNVRKKKKRRPSSTKEYGAEPHVKLANMAAVSDRYIDFVNGKLTIADLDDEEIMRGQLRAKDGTFRGAPPRWIPREFMVQVMAERDQRMRSELMPLAMDAMKTLKQAMSSGTTVHDGPKITAAVKALEYTIGKPTERVQITGDVKVTQYSNIIDEATVAIGELEQMKDDEEAGDI